MENIVILGAGESGVGAALLAKKNNKKVFLSEYGKINEKFKSELENNAIDFEEGGHSFDKIDQATLIIKSPGIPEKAPIIKHIRKQNIELISEIEFAYQFCEAKIIAITGSNGKTTTTLLTHHILLESNVSVGLGGNVGRSFARVLAEDEKKDFYVIELSSFQLDDIKEFKADIAMILNITADHLDRYEYKIENYAASKCRIAENQTKNDILIYNGQDAGVLKYLDIENSHQRLISIEISNKENTSLLTSNEQKIDITNYKLKGQHNVFNALCAVEATIAVGVSIENIETALTTFSNAAHRLEKVARIDDVLYVNDSKATNVDSVYYALDAFEESIVWIAGGTDKGNDYSQILPLVKDKVKALICLGVDNSKLLDYFTPHVKNIEETQDIKKALEISRQLAEKNDVVLLSPACASFDLFNNYIHRGELFKKAVFSLVRSK